MIMQYGQTSFFKAYLIVAVQIVDPYYLIAFIQQFLWEVKADESCRTGNQNLRWYIFQGQKICRKTKDLTTVFLLFLVIPSFRLFLAKFLFPHGR